MTSCATAVEPQGTPSPLRPSPQLGRGDGGEGAAQLPTATAQPGLPVAVTVAASGRALDGLVAYASNRFDHFEIYLYDLDRDEIIQWTGDDAEKRNPIWSPDGHTLAYASLGDGSWQLYRRGLAGGREYKLTSAPGENYEPAWSPDGKLIAFTSNRDGREQIYLMDESGNGARNLSRNNSSDFQPAWSPDGSMIAFSSNRDGNWEIYIMNADGSNPRNLTRSMAGEWSPAFSPDGKRLAFVSDRDGNQQIYVVALDAADTTPPVNLSKHSGSDWSPVWSPDGARIMFISKRDGNFELYLMNADGSGLRRLTNQLSDDIQPAWRSSSSAAGATRPPVLSALNRRTDEGPKLVTTWHFTDNVKIDGMRSSAIQALSQDETAYPVSGGAVYGFEPGDLYPQIYIRDTSWMDIAAMYFYPAYYVSDTIEEFLRRQYTANQPVRPAASVYPGDGAISGLFSPQISYDKHTTTSDEETNLIRAAYVYYSDSGDRGWLKKEIAGQTVIARLNKAMEWLLANRLDPTTGLIKRAHTTDWGDVKIEKTGSPTDLSPGDALTVSSFDQAMAYQALVNLSAMNRAVGNVPEAIRYRAQAEELKAQFEKFMWQPTRGFYRTHLHLTPLTHNFDEDAIVSIANALVVYTGLSDRIAPLDKLEEATRTMGAIKPGLSLFPPYPTGVFAYVQMTEGNYQNGGLWDWWGGTQITAEFERGLKTRALAHLYQVAEDWAKHPRDIYEWQFARTGVSRGSDNYGGSVATMTEAVVRGLYGIRIEPQAVSVSPRLGEHSGWIRVYIPTSGLYVGYRYQYNRPVLQIQYESNAPQEIAFRVAMPPGAVPAKLTLDGQNAAFRLESLNEDDYAVFNAATGTHVIEITTSVK
ncbi:MAG: PD40 domain-containing protein [Chloroflexi bacterium]|nr:PD40 domain-containing protein [Chloroflexota bacterium]